MLGYSQENAPQNEIQMLIESMNMGILVVGKLIKYINRRTTYI